MIFDPGVFIGQPAALCSLPPSPLPPDIAYPYSATTRRRVNARITARVSPRLSVVRQRTTSYRSHNRYSQDVAARRTTLVISHFSARS